MLETIESAIEDIKNGKLVIVVDDEDRENGVAHQHESHTEVVTTEQHGECLSKSIVFNRAFDAFLDLNDSL